MLNAPNLCYLVKADGSKSSGDDLTGTYIAVSSGSGYTFKAVKACKLLVVYVDSGGIHSSIANYSANQQILISAYYVANSKLAYIAAIK